MGWSKSFDTRPQRDLISKRGMCVLWEQTAPCSCTPPGEAPDPTCAACHGTGRVLLNSKVIRGIVTSATQDRTLMQAGWVEEGDLLFSQYPNSCNQLNDLDRIILIEAGGGEPFVGERLTRGRLTKDQTAYNVQVVTSVTQSDVDTGIITTYVKGTDYTVSGRAITWIGTHAPIQGSTYAIQYRANFEYTVVNPPSIRYEGTTNLGQRIILRLRNIQGLDNANRVQVAEYKSAEPAAVTPASTSGDGSSTGSDISSVGNRQ